MASRSGKDAALSLATLSLATKVTPRLLPRTWFVQGGRAQRASVVLADFLSGHRD